MRCTSIKGKVVHGRITLVSMKKSMKCVEINDGLKPAGASYGR